MFFSTSVFNEIRNECSFVIELYQIYTFEMIELKVKPDPCCAFDVLR